MGCGVYRCPATVVIPVCAVECGHPQVSLFVVIETCAPVDGGVAFVELFQPFFVLEKEQIIYLRYPQPSFAVKIQCHDGVQVFFVSWIRSQGRVLLVKNIHSTVLHTDETLVGAHPNNTRGIDGDGSRHVPR